MKKRNLLIIAMFVSSVLSMAADVQSLVVEPKSGIESVIALSDIQCIIFSGANVIVEKKDTTHCYYSVSAVQKLLFGMRSSTNNISKVEALSVKAYPNPSTDVLFIEGIETVEKLHLYSLMGTELAVKYTLLNNGLQINVSALSQGFYLLQVNNQAIKIQKQ